MRTGLTHLSSLIAILMILASGTWGVQARTRAPAVDQVVLCTGTGVVTIDVDANGIPTSMPQHCQECYGMTSGLVLPSTNPFTQYTAFLFRCWGRKHHPPHWMDCAGSSGAWTATELTAFYLPLYIHIL